MTAFIITLCGFLPFPILVVLKACGCMETWTYDEQLGSAMLAGYVSMLLLLAAAVWAVVGICRKRQRGWNMASLLLILAWPLVCGLLQYLFC